MNKDVISAVELELRQSGGRIISAGPSAFDPSCLEEHWVECTKHWRWVKVDVDLFVSREPAQALYEAALEALAKCPDCINEKASNTRFPEGAEL